MHKHKLRYVSKLLYHLICIIFVQKGAMVPAVVCHSIFSAAKWGSYFWIMLFLVKCEANVLPCYRRIVGEANHSSRRSITQLLQIACLIPVFDLKKALGFCAHLTQAARNDATAQHLHLFSLTTPVHSICWSQCSTIVPQLLSFNYNSWCHFILQVRKCHC